METDDEKGHRKDYKNLSKIKWQKSELKEEIEKVLEMERKEDA